jgi:hypothetical protein
MVPVYFYILGGCRKGLRGGWLTRGDAGALEPL